MKQWYVSLFENYAKKYEQEVYTQGTIGECDFFEMEIENNKSVHILDLGCGIGRHSIELARRGYHITGVDLSESMLAAAREKAAALQLDIDFIRQDARELTFQNEFDAAIMICEGGFSLMETDEMNFQILKGLSKALKPGGKLIFTALSALFPLFHSVKEFMDSQDVNNGLKYEPQSFDLMTFRESNSIVVTDDSGQEMALSCNERYYTPSEISWMLKSLGFEDIGIYGAKLGAFSRNDALTTEDFEMLVVAKMGEK